MRLYNVNGKLVNKNVRKYLIKWDALSASKIQFQVKQFLKSYWSLQLVYEEFLCFGCKLRVDFLNATKKIAVEVNGPQHGTFNKFFHNNSRTNFLDSIKRDEIKYQWLIKNNFKVLELEEDDIPLLSKEYIEKKFGISI